MARSVQRIRPKFIILTDRDAEDLRSLRKELIKAHAYNWDEYMMSLSDVFQEEFTDRIEELEALNPKLKDMNKRLIRNYGRSVRRYIDDVDELGDDGYMADVHMMLDTFPGIANIVVEIQTLGTMPLPMGRD